MDWDFKKIPFTIYTYISAKILQNCGKFRYAKAGFKNYRNLNNFRQAVESPKSWNLMGFCPKKYIPSAKTLYTVDLSNITFNYLRVESPNYLCHFWKHKSFFSTQLLCIFISLNITLLSTKVAHQHANFPLFSSPNSSCHFSNKKLVFLQSLDIFSVPWEIIILYFLSWNFIRNMYSGFT